MKNTPTDPVPLLQDLIRCKSVTPAEGGRAHLSRKPALDPWLRLPAADLPRGGNARRREPLRPHRLRQPASLLRRPHRRGARGDRRELDACALRGRHRRWLHLWPRRLRHEGLGRGLRRRRHRLRARGRQVQGLDLLPHHRRRGRPRHQRHGEGAAVDGARTATSPTIASSASRAAWTSWATPSRSAAAAR